MKDYPKIPRSIQILKEQSGENWKWIRKLLNKYLTYKRVIDKSNLDKGDKQIKSYLQGILLKNFLTKCYPFDYTPAPMDAMSLYSHLQNALKTLKKLEYRSIVVCYLNDTWNTAKSGNKKYPQFK